ncbi:MAG: amino acid transporter substrate-binding protein family [Alphaproteobacteria bacterium]|nr:amino acid transporter substrate-binding protein family [Alphaproteobacteria bacterium]
MYAKMSSIICLTLFLAFPAFAAEPVFDRVMKTKTINGGYFVYPPYITKDTNTGKFSGINYDIMEAVARNLGLKLNWSAELGLGDVATGLNTGKADVMCASLWPSPDRLATMTYTMPTFYDVNYAFVRADDKRFDGDLQKANQKEIKVAGVEGDVSADLAREKLPHAVPQFLPQTASIGETLLYLTTKKAEIVFVDEAIVNDFSKNNPNKLRKVEGIGPVRVFGEHITLPLGEYHLRDMLNVSLQQLVNDGVIQAITEKYSKEYHSRFIAPAKSFTAAE